MTRLLKSSWLAALIGCLLYLGVTAALIRLPSLNLTRPAKPELKITPGDDPAWKFKNPEFEQMVNDLVAERQALKQREEQLNALQERLTTEHQEVDMVIHSVSQLQSNFDSGVIHFNSQETDNLKRQVKVLGAMSPEGAVKVLDQMPDEETVHILTLMNADQASLYLDTLSKMGSDEARHAAKLLDAMRRAMPGPTANSRPKPTP